MVCSAFQAPHKSLIASHHSLESHCLRATRTSFGVLSVSSSEVKRHTFAETSRSAKQRQHACKCVKSAGAAVKFPDSGLHKSFSPKQSFALIPVGLLIGLSLAWGCTLRCSIATQTSILLLLDITYAGLHLQPLLPLLQHSSSPDVAFMHCYTRAWYFVSECLILLWLLSSQVIREKVPSVILAAHGVVHIGFVGLAGLAPGWCLQQQMKRIQNGWNTSGLVGIWHTLVNMVNFADLSLHMCYIEALWRGLGKLTPAGASLALWQQPVVVASVGAVLAYIMAQWLPHQQYRQHVRAQYET